MTSSVERRAVVAGLSVILTACASGPAVPDWQMNAQSGLERFTAAYMSGNALVETTEFTRARGQIAATGKIELVARAELLRCAARAASLVFEDCTGFEALRQDAAPAEQAYADYLNGSVKPAEIGLLPERQRGAAAASSDTALAAAVAGIADPLARLVASGVALRTGRASPALLAGAVDTASAQGWRRPLLAWLGVQKMRASQAGDTREAARIGRKIDLVAGTDGTLK